MTWASSKPFLSENYPSFPIQEPGKIYEKRRKFYENRAYKKTEGHGALLQRKNPMAEIYTHDTKLKRRLAEYAAKFPALCQLTEDDEQGGLRFEIAKERISIRLTAPYSEERKNNTRKWAKENGLQGKYDRKKQENAETEENTGKPLRE